MSNSAVNVGYAVWWAAVCGPDVLVVAMPSCSSLNPTRSFFQLADFSTTTRRGVQSATAPHSPRLLKMCPSYAMVKMWSRVLVARH